MAVGKLTVTPETVRGFPSPGFEDARLFVGCFVQESDKHRTHSESGPEPSWNKPLYINVPEGQNYLHIEVVNESQRNGGILATAKVALSQVFNLGNEARWVQLNSSSGRSFGELKLDLSFSGSNSVNSVTSSFGEMNLAGGGHASYQQTTSHSSYTSHNQSESRQSSYSSLGPSNPIPENYGTGAPPPFNPPAAVPYHQNSTASMPGTSMPGANNGYVGTPTAGGLVNAEGVVSPEKMSKGEFEEAKAKGSIPTWAKYGGGALAGAAALGLAAWGGHELKEHFDRKDEEENRKDEKKDTKPFVPPPGYLRPENSQQQSYTIENKDHQKQQQQQPQPQQHFSAPQQQHYPAPPQQHYPAPPQQHSGRDNEHKKEKKEKKKEKKHNKKHGSGSDSSSSSDSDSSDDERKGKKHDKHKKRDSDWK